MKATITSKGQITIPAAIRRKLKLEPGQVLEFDENAPYLKALKVFDVQGMYSVIGCSKDAMPGVNGGKWLDETRGPVEQARDNDENGG